MMLIKDCSTIKQGSGRKEEEEEEEEFGKNYFVYFL